MSIFTLQHIPEIDGRIRFFKLRINGKCQYDDFLEEINCDGNLKRELNIIQTRMMDVARCLSLPAEKFKDITPKKDKIKEYEIKTKHLRVYMFHDDTSGRVIVLGGKKTNQPKDIERFRQIKKKYLDAKK